MTAKRTIFQPAVRFARSAWTSLAGLFTDMPERYYSVIREAEESRRKKFSSAVLILTTPFFFLFLLHHVLRGNIIPIVFNSLLIVTQLANVFYFSKTRFWNAANGFSLFMYAVYFHIAIALGGPDGSYGFWAILFPFAALCLVTPGAAFRWTILFMAGTILLVIAGPKYIDMYSYAPGMLLRLYLVIIIMVVIIFQFERTRVSLYSSLKLNDEKLMEEMKKSDEARAMAVEALRVKDRFLASVSHEIRTPLSLIIGMSDLASKESDAAKIPEYLNDINDSSQHLLMLVNNVLDFTKLESEIIELEDKPFNLEELVETIARSFSLDFRAKDLYLENRYDEKLPRYFSGDATRIRQIISNLISNAFKYTERGGVSIRTGFAEDEDRAVPGPAGSPGYLPVRIDIQDTGVGISQDQFGEIFLPFVQIRLHGGPQAGVGLGLAIVKKLVDIMNGTILVERAEGGGTQFSVILPLPVAAEPDSSSTAPRRSERPVRQDSLVILLAEDNAAIIKMVMTALSRSGHDIVSAVNGYEVLDVMTKRRVDVVLMDIEMPLLDGIETAKRIRSGSCGESGWSVPIIALTAHVLAEVEDQCRRAGMNGIIRKPFELFSLEDEIKKIISDV